MIVLVQLGIRLTRCLEEDSYYDSNTILVIVIVRSKNIDDSYRQWYDI